MKCSICEGRFKKSQLFYSFGYAYCPICGENLGKANMFIKLKKMIDKNLMIKPNATVEISL